MSCGRNDASSGGGVLLQTCFAEQVTAARDLDEPAGTLQGCLLGITHVPGGSGMLFGGLADHVAVSVRSAALADPPPHPPQTQAANSRATAAAAGSWASGLISSNHQHVWPRSKVRWRPQQCTPGGPRGQSKQQQHQPPCFLRLAQPRPPAACPLRSFHCRNQSFGSSNEVELLEIMLVSGRGAGGAALLSRGPG